MINDAPCGLLIERLRTLTSESLSAQGPDINFYNCGSTFQCNCLLTGPGEILLLFLLQVLTLSALKMQD